MRFKKGKIAVFHRWYCNRMILIRPDGLMAGFNIDYSLYSEDFLIAPCYALLTEDGKEENGEEFWETWGCFKNPQEAYKAMRQYEKELLESDPFSTPRAATATFIGWL